jgi:DNA (cytosine-5)-methyltransferase 1
MTHLDLFSGIGGFALAARCCGIETIAFCENDLFCQKVLRKHWYKQPIYNDIKTFNRDFIYNGEIDLVTAGFPCQPYSVAGKRKGESDDRALWNDLRGVLSEIRPPWFIGENVTGIINLGLEKMLFDLESIGYEVATFVIPACAVGAEHRRDRIWIIAHADSNGLQGQFSKICETTRSRNITRDRGNDVRYGRYSLPESAILRRNNGISRRVDRARSLGNAIVPQIAERIIKSILCVEHTK